MGIMSLAGYLRTKFDVELCLVNQRLHNLSDEALVRQMMEFGADVIGLSGLTPAAHHFDSIGTMAREALPQALLVLGGPHVNSFGAAALKNTTAHAAVPGAGERALELIIRAWRDKKGLSDIPGIFWRDTTGEIVENPGQVPQIEDIDSMPFPAYDLIDLPSYWKRQSMLPVPRRHYASLFSSRGCSYQCSWCHCIFGKKFQGHSAERVVEEIEVLQKRYQIKDFEFIDDVFNFDHKRVSNICDMLHKKNITTQFAFPNGIRGDILNDSVLDALNGAGTYFCSFALETGNPRLQEAMGKKLNIPRFLANVEASVKRGIFTNGFAMLGFPTETEADMRMTIDVASESHLHTCSFFTVVPFPNTKIYDMVMQLHPERISKITFDDLHCCNSKINLSEVSDEALLYYQRLANRLFFLNPKRLWRIMRDYPQRLKLPYYIPIFLYRISKGMM